MEPVNQADLDRTKVSIGDDFIEFVPEGALGPLRFEGLGSCGIASPGISVESRMNGKWEGACVMTADQVVALIQYLNGLLPMLRPINAKVGDPLPRPAAPAADANEG